MDIARMMDVLRQMAIETGVGAREKNVLKFHEAFLAGIKRGGRINEPMMMVQYKLKSGDLFSDVAMGIGYVHERQAVAAFSADERYEIG
ncbi:MAG: hypothetical protein MZV70_27390 [Desulfobacterales bacterium]|nr:hypothetical protein [Desulfobacterales bacterium]